MFVFISVRFFRLCFTSLFILGLTFFVFPIKTLLKPNGIPPFSPTFLPNFEHFLLFHSLSYFSPPFIPDSRVHDIFNVWIPYIYINVLLQESSRKNKPPYGNKQLSHIWSKVFCSWFVIKSQFSYYFLMWMFCSSFLFNLLIKIQERALIHKGHVTFFKDILGMTK